MALDFRDCQREKEVSLILYFGFYVDLRGRGKKEMKICKTQLDRGRMKEIDR